MLQNAAGEPFAFEILLQRGRARRSPTSSSTRCASSGSTARVQLVDAAQYNERRNDYDYDMIVNTWNMSLSPGNEQTLYWGSAGVTEPGTRNYMGVASPAAEAMIADDAGDARPGGVRGGGAGARPGADHRALRDPVLVLRRSLIAHKADLKHPERLPVYGDWIGWLPEVWWHAPRVRTARAR